MTSSTVSVWFTNADGHCRQPDRTTAKPLTQIAQEDTVDFVETAVIDSEYRQAIGCGLLVDHTIASDLGEVTNPTGAVDWRYEEYHDSWWRFRPRRPGRSPRRPSRRPG